MTAGDTTQGRRIYNKENDDTPVPPYMEPGDYYKDDYGTWWVCAPRTGGGAGRLELHKIVEHEDGTITVSPSILMAGLHSWHGYLEHGVWREV